jgi:hypothetical protein
MLALMLSTALACKADGAGTAHKIPGTERTALFPDKPTVTGPSPDMMTNTPARQDQKPPFDIWRMNRVLLFVMSIVVLILKLSSWPKKPPDKKPEKRVVHNA